MTRQRILQSDHPQPGLHGDDQVTGGVREYRVHSADVDDQVQVGWWQPPGPPGSGSLATLRSPKPAAARRTAETASVLPGQATQRAGTPSTASSAPASVTSPQAARSPSSVVTIRTALPGPPPGAG